MKFRFLNATLALLITFSLATPAAFFAAPQKAHAFPVEEVGNLLGIEITTGMKTAMALIQETISAVNSATASAAQTALVIDRYVLQPLAFVMSGKLLKTLTAGVIAFAIGKANGTGVPQFAADVQASLRTAGDARTIAFLNSYMRSSQSPYSGSIVAALRRDYFNETSLAGFWAANMDTLRATSPNPYGFLRGNWALGGVSAWFALTTQDNNSPYALYLNGKNKLARVVGVNPDPGVIGQKAADLRAGNGFASWCGARSDTLGQMPNDLSYDTMAGLDEAATGAFTSAYEASLASNPSDYEAARSAGAAAESEAKRSYLQSLEVRNTQNYNPGDPCVNSDGTMGVVKTPGSVIVNGLNKVLGGEQDNIVRMGNVGPEITSIMTNIATVIKTVDLATKIFQGPGGGGLFAVDTQSMARSDGNLGVGASAVYQHAANLPASGSDMTNRISQFESKWNTIRDSANTASTSLASLRSYCISQRSVASTTLSNLNLYGTELTSQQAQYKQQLVAFMASSADQADAVTAAFTIIVTPILTQASVASSTIADAKSLVARVQAALNNPNDGTGEAYAANVQRLQTMPPTATDIATIEQEVQPIGTEAANPTGSLNVSGGTIVGRLNLLSANAPALKSAKCTMPTSSGIN